MFGLSRKLSMGKLNTVIQRRYMRILNPQIGKSGFPMPSKVPPTSLLSMATNEDIVDEIYSSDNDNKPKDYSNIVNQAPKDDFLSTLILTLKNNTFQKLYLDENKQLTDQNGVFHQLKTVTGRLVKLNAGLRLQLVYAYKTNDITKNIPIEEVEDVIRKLLDNACKKAKLTSNESTYTLNFYKSVSNGKLTVTTNEKIEEVSLNHDRKKNVPVDSDAPFLRALKVTQGNALVHICICILFTHINT
jgi:hypothetical protein